MSNLTPYRDAPLDRPVWEGKHICAQCVHFSPTPRETLGGKLRHECKRTIRTRLNVITGEQSSTGDSCESLNSGYCRHFTTPEGHLILRDVHGSELTLWQRLYHFFCFGVLGIETWPKRPQPPLP